MTLVSGFAIHDASALTCPGLGLFPRASRPFPVTSLAGLNARGPRTEARARERRRQLSACLLLASIAVGASPRVQAAGTAPIAAACGSARSLPLVLVNEGGADRATVDVSLHEAEAIWAAAGVRLVWTILDDTGDSAAFRGPFVVLRRRLSHRSTKAESLDSRRAQLGRVIFDRADRSPRLVEVSLTDVVAAASRANRTAIVPQPNTFVRPELIGRALGRVIAHEIGHWLFGRGHAADGVMRASLRPSDLVAPRRPAVAALWLASRTEHLPDAFAPCAVAGSRASGHRDDLVHTVGATGAGRSPGACDPGPGLSRRHPRSSRRDSCR